MHHPHFFGGLTCAGFGGHVQRQVTQQLIEALQHGLGVRRHEDFNQTVGEFVFQTPQKSRTVVVQQLVGPAVNHNTLALFAKGREATVHLQSVCCPEENFRIGNIALLTHISHFTEASVVVRSIKAP